MHAVRRRDSTQVTQDVGYGAGEVRGDKQTASSTVPSGSGEPARTFQEVRNGVGQCSMGMVTHGDVDRRSGEEWRPEAADESVLQVSHPDSVPWS